MIRVEFPYAARCGRGFAMRCHVISSVDKYAFFRWGTVTLPFPPYRFYCRPSRPPKLCSRLHKYTMFRNVCQVADYVNVHVSERLSNGHVQSRGDPGMVFTIRNLFMKPASAVLREREGAFIMATNMTNSEAMVTSSAASYTTYGCPRHQNIFTKTTLSKGAFSDA